MAAAGFKSTVSLTVGESDANLTDGVTGHTVSLTELEGRLLQLYKGQTPEQLASQAQAAGIGLWPDQVRVVLERIEAHGFLARPLAPQVEPGPPLGSADVVPRFRADLSLSKAPGSRSAIQVVDPVTQQAFSLFDFEASIARMLNGSRTVGQVIELAAKIGITVTADSLDRFVRQLRSFGFLDEESSSAPPTAWDPREAWSPDVRELFQAALRLVRSGHPQEAIGYLDAILQTHPELPEALELRARAEAAAGGAIDLTLPFNELHAAPSAPSAPGALPPPPPPPLPDEETTDVRRTVEPPRVAPLPVAPRLQGLGILPPPQQPPAPRLSPPRVPPLPAPAAPPAHASPRSTLVFGSAPPPPRSSPLGATRSTLVFGSAPPVPPAGSPAEPPRAALEVTLPAAAPAAQLGGGPRSTLVFGDAPLGLDGDGPPPVTDASAPRSFNAVLFGSSAGSSSLGSDPVASTEPHVVASTRRDAPPRASPPPRGAQALADPLGVDAPPPAPLVDAEAALEPPPPVSDEPSVQVDSMAFVPDGASVQVDPSLGDPVPDFAASASDAPAEEPRPPPRQLPPDLLLTPPADAPREPAPEFPAVESEPVVVPRKHRGLTIAAVGVSLLAAVMAVPVPREVEAICALSPVVVAEPKAASDGKVAELVVKSGDVVAAGTVLVKLTVPEPVEAGPLAEKEQALRAKAKTLEANAKTSPKARKAGIALARAEKELARAKAAYARVENRKAADKARLKKALDAKQKAHDKAVREFDREHATKRRAAYNAEADQLAEERARLTREAAGTEITAPAAGRFDAPAKHAVGMGLSAGERYGLIVDPAVWRVQAAELPPATEPATARVHLESGRIIDLTSTTLSGEGATRTLEGNALLSDDAAAAGKTVLKVRAGRRPLAVLLWSRLKPSP